MASGWRGVQVMSVTALASMALVLTACGSSPNAAPTTRGSSADTTGVSKSTTTLNSTASAVLQAYRASWKAFEQASSTANAYDQELAATMVGTQLQNVRANLLGDQHAGAVGEERSRCIRKSPRSPPRRASVVDCAYSTSELIYAKSGKQVPPITPPENDGIQSTLVLTGGTWKVSQQNVTEGHCASRLVIPSLFLARSGGMGSLQARLVWSGGRRGQNTSAGGSASGGQITVVAATGGSASSSGLAGREGWLERWLLGGTQPLPVQLHGGGPSTATVSRPWRTDTRRVGDLCLSGHRCGGRPAA